jgi:hypothetical protein
VLLGNELGFHRLLMAPREKGTARA